MKFVSKEKLSKKKQKELNKQHRNFWLINPITRTPKNPKAYDRNKEKNWMKSLDDSWYRKVY